MVKNTIWINGKEYTVDCDPRTSLADYLRDHVGLKGTKVMCGEGGCGVCVVVVQSKHPITGKIVTKAINSCLCPLGNVIGCHLTTVEGVGNQHSGFHPIQKSIAEHNGSQCGYCTPGMVMNMYGLSCKDKNLTPTEIVQSLDGNLCRCTGYRGIIEGSTAALCGGRSSVTDIEDLGSFMFGNAVATFKPSDHWFRPTALKEVFRLFDQRNGKPVKLIVGNTSSGWGKPVMDLECILVDLKHIKELYAVEVSEECLHIGANLTIQDLIDEFTRIGSDKESGFCYLLQTLVPMMNKIGGRPVRNAGCWAGNLMLKHKYSNFVSDLFTPLEALQAKITVASVNNTASYSMGEFLRVDMNNKVIVSMSIPALNPDRDRFQCFKIMPRAANALAILNAGLFVKLKKYSPDDCVEIQSARIVFGGMANFIRATLTEEYLQGRIYSKDLLAGSLEMVEKELGLNGNKYKATLGRNILFLFLKHACNSQLSYDQFCAKTTKKCEEISTAYDFDTKTDKYPACKPIPKLDSLLQCSGEAQYTDDRPHLEGELQAYCVLSSQARAKIDRIDTSKAEDIPGVVRILTACDIPGANVLSYDTGDGSVLPILAENQVLYAGQPVAIILAKTTESAKQASSELKITYTDVHTPIIDIEDAVEKNYRHKNDENFDLHVMRGDVNENLASADQVITGKVKLNTQYHFYMENQCCLAVPHDDMLDMWVTSQGPAAAQKVVAKVIGKPMARINMHVSRLGGGFGGKSFNSCQPAALTATAATAVNSPVRMSLSLEQCMKMLGKRMPFLAKYRVAVCNGAISAIDLDYYHDCGCKYKSDAAEMIDEIIRNIQTVYHIPHWDLRGHPMKTDKPVTTSMRAPTTLPGSFIIESILEHVSAELYIDPLEFKQRHFAKTGDPCLHGVDHSREAISKLWSELLESSQVFKWKSNIDQFNKENCFIKRGLAVIPTCSPLCYYGALFSYSAYVTVYTDDGTVSITHGGVEMGQGLNTKAIQTAASTLNVDSSLIQIHPTSSLTSANNYFTGGSIGSEAVARSVYECCQILNQRLLPLRIQNPSDTWRQIVQKAYSAGVDLAVSHKHTLPEKSPYSTFGVCALEAEVDLLTGQHGVNRLDALFDVGESMNPTLDVGQIEGALTMSLGYFQSEKEKYDLNTGELLTKGTWDYKPPTALDIPKKMNIKLMKDGSNPKGMMPFKAIGEPPINCGPAVLFAVRQAVQNYRASKGKLDYLQLCQPISGMEILDQCHITVNDLMQEV